MSYPVKNGQTSMVLRFKLLDSASGTGAGKTGLTSSSTGLIIATIADNEATTTAYTQAGSTIQTITTLGTYAAPSANNCRFKEVDSVNHPGVYEFQFADARFAVSSAKSLLVSVSGVAGLAQCDYVLPLTVYDPYSALATPTNITAGTITTVSGNVNGSVGSVTGAVGSVTAGVTVTTNNDKTGYTLIQTFPTNFAALGITAGGHISNVDTLTTYTGNTLQTGDSFTRLGAPAGASVSADIASISTQTGSIAAVKTQTDKMAFTVTNVIDANIHYVNDVKVNGVGTAGSPWGP